MNTAALESPQGLLDKELAASPTTWKEWLDQWNASNDPMKLAALLYNGFNMPDYKYWKVDAGVIMVYLRTATLYHKKRSFPDEYMSHDQGDTVMSKPKTYIAKTAFNSLCDNLLQPVGSNNTPWFYFCLRPGMLRELMRFLGYEPGETDSTGFHILMVYSGGRRELLEKFCTGLAEFIVNSKRLVDLRGLSENEASDIREGCLSYMDAAVSMLLYMEKERLILEKWSDAERPHVLSSLEKWIMSHRSLAHSDLREIKEVRRVLRVHLRDYQYNWSHGTSDVARIVGLHALLRSLS